MLNKINEFPIQNFDAWQLIASHSFEEFDAGRINQIIIAGMGGRAIGGDFVPGHLQQKFPVPVFTHRSDGRSA